MALINESSAPLEDFTDEELSELVKANDALDLEEDRFVKEEKEEEERRKNEIKTFSRLRKSPLEIFNRSLFLVFIVSFVASFYSIYGVNRLWFFLYLISAFSCILYVPNRKALKELLDAWPNIKDLISKRSRWKK